MNKVKIFLLVYMLAFFVLLPLYAYDDPFMSPWEKEELKELKKQHNQENANIAVDIQDISRPDMSQEEFVDELEQKTEKKERPDFVVDGIVWQSSEKGIVISGNKFYKVGDYINSECKVSNIIGRRVLVVCGEYVWEYTVNGG